MVVVVLLFGAARLFLPWDQLRTGFLVSAGAAYAFHVTLTLHMLKTRQSDITENGYVFSAAVIFIGNALVLLLGLALLSPAPGLPTALSWCWESTIDLVLSVREWVG